MVKPQITQIKVTKEMRKTLKGLKITNRESYQEILTRLVNQARSQQ